MYHEIGLPGRPLCQSAYGYERYVPSLETFRRQMAWIRESGWHGLSVGEAIRYPDGPGVCITFDDGCETDLIAAAPVLREFGCNATFYLTAGFLGRPGFLTASQVRELDAQGFEIGCHSMTHPYIPDLSEIELKREVVDAKLVIEQIVGHAIEQFSCPGGSYDRRTLRMVRQSGFATFANSRFHANSSRTSRYDLGRVAVLRDFTIEEFSTICQGRGLWKRSVQYKVRRGAQRVLGNRGYDRLRAMLLGDSVE
jgi:peptidoglycan/xylan/chitin deacetylase (PgdA/CDA1 family)